MKKSGFAKGVFWTLSIGIVFVIILAAVGVVAYNGYTNASLEASYSRGDKETTIKIEKKDKLSSEITSVDSKPTQTINCVRIIIIKKVCSYCNYNGYRNKIYY